MPLAARRDPFPITAQPVISVYENIDHDGEHVQLHTITILGFRSIAHLNGLTLGSPTLLTGHNDAGKSALLEAIRFLLNEYELTDRDPTFAMGEAP